MRSGSCSRIVRPFRWYSVVGAVAPIHPQPAGRRHRQPVQPALLDLAACCPFADSHRASSCRVRVNGSGGVSVCGLGLASIRNPGRRSLPTSPRVRRPREPPRLPIGKTQPPHRDPPPLVLVVAFTGRPSTATTSVGVAVSVGMLGEGFEVAVLITGLVGRDGSRTRSRQRNEIYVGALSTPHQARDSVPAT